MISILLYHQIAEVSRERDPLGLSVPPRLFARQMEYLYERGYRSVPLSEAVELWRRRLPTPVRGFVLTFDDGYRDFLDGARPVLDRLGFTATIFLVAGRLGLDSNWEGQRGAASGMLLSWPEIRELASAGYSFGSHGLTHAPLTQLGDEQVRREMVDSKSMIEDGLGRPVHHFSYPYYEVDDRIRGLAAESGYLAACAGHTDAWSLHNLWRAQCKGGDGMASFAWKAEGWFHRYIWLREGWPLGLAARRQYRALRGLARGGRG
jgi:peptidoglycan/xylan/chitin deacetylase (PgdA/CDA1 family)